AQTLGRRALAFAPIDEHIQAALAYVVAALALLALTVHGRRGLPRMLALPARAPLWLFVAVLGGVASGAFAVGYRAFLRKVGVEVPAGATDGDVRLVIAAVTVVLAPIAEEIFFRGWLQNTIEGELPTARRWLAPLLAALAFASVRAPMSLVPIFVLGIVTGVLYARTRSVGPGMAAHAVHVAVSLAARYYLEV
ncbi:MAG: hypothetical protein QOI41_5781, partial [Myxococcales bacterium]|nr:hypothetical protein [Myxococcales bacterium]